MPVDLKKLRDNDAERTSALLYAEQARETMVQLLRNNEYKGFKFYYQREHKRLLAVNQTLGRRLSFKKSDTFDLIKRQIDSILERTTHT